MKRKMTIIISALVISCILFSGCGGKTDSGKTSAAESKTTVYEYTFRTIKNNYITPAASFAGGKGTAADPYRISNASELALMAEKCNAESSSDSREFLEASYILSEDIKLNALSGTIDWAKEPPQFAWMPIANKNRFSGVFDGGGHSISGMYVNEDFSVENSVSYAFGLFGNNLGTIKNLTVDNSYVSVSGYTTYVGGIAGNNLKGAAISNCSCNAEVCCYDAKCGGITGINNAGARVDSCTFGGTVNVIKADSHSITGGIVGYNFGDVSSCSSKGTVKAETGVTVLGGIVGTHNGGSITDCTNDAVILNAEKIGGIAGTVNSIGSSEAPAEIKDCTNNAPISADAKSGGGIAGEVLNDRGKHPIGISGCTNRAAVSAKEKSGGIIGLTTVYGEINVSSCTNEAEISGKQAGGIIASCSALFGGIKVSDCKNTGKITSEVYGAGIIAENNLMIAENKPLSVEITGSINSGMIDTAYCGGGITGAFIDSISEDEKEKLTVVLENDINSGDIFCHSDNAFVGGITGNIGVPGAAINITGCSASGNISFADNGVDEETVNFTAGRAEFSRIAGSIVGYIDNGLYLSTTGDALNPFVVNSANAKLKITDCSGSCTFDAPAEDKYVYKSDSTPIFLNKFGGLIGACNGEKGYEFSVVNCRRENCEKGLGNKDFPDVGTKAS